MFYVMKKKHKEVKMIWSGNKTSEIEVVWEFISSRSPI